MTIDTNLYWAARPARTCVSIAIGIRTGYGGITHGFLSYVELIAYVSCRLMRPTTIIVAIIRRVDLADRALAEVLTLLLVLMVV